MVEAVNREDDPDAELDNAEERSITNVTEKRGGGRKIAPLIFLGIVAFGGLALVVRGVMSGDGAQARSVGPSAPSAARYSTGVSRNNDRIPAFQDLLDDEPVPRPEPERERPAAAAPPVDRMSSQFEMLRNRQNLAMDRMREEQAIKLEGADAAFEMQRKQAEYQSQIDIEKTLKKRREAPALIFDDSKDED